MDAEIEVGVEGIEFAARHGVSDDEAERGNRFRVDVRMTGPWSRALQTDDLRDTLDVAAVVEHIHRVSRRRFHLIESFAAAVADDLLRAFPDATQARVRVRKLEFPEWGPQACSIAEVTRRPTT